MKLNGNAYKGVGEILRPFLKIRTLKGEIIDDVAQGKSEIGNKLTEEQQWAKLRLVKEIAEEVWDKDGHIG